MRKVLGSFFMLVGACVLMFWSYQFFIDPGGAISREEAMPALPAGLLLFVTGLVAALAGGARTAAGVPGGPPSGGSRVGVGVAGFFCLASAWQVLSWGRFLLYIGPEAFILVRVLIYGVLALAFGGLAAFLHVRRMRATQGGAAPTF